MNIYKIELKRIQKHTNKLYSGLFFHGYMPLSDQSHPSNMIVLFNVRKT